MKLSLVVLGCIFGHALAFCPVRPSARTSIQLLRASIDPLATEGDWSAFLDRDNTGMVYYFNTKTGESRWDAPTDTFPSVRMDEETKRVAREKRLAYVEQQEEQQEPKKKGFLASIIEKTEEPKEEEVVVEEKAEEPNWFDGLFEIKPADPETPTEEKKETPIAKEETPVKASGDENAGFLSSLFDPETPTEEKKETPIAKEETPVKASGDENAGFLSILFGRNGAVKNGKVESKPLGVADKVFTTGASKVVDVDIASFVLAHPAKVSWGGEDAVFVKGRSFGVFDGVSGADKLDGIPLFSYTLADEMKRTMKEDGAKTKDMIKCLNDAAAFANRAATGASTAIVASIGQDDFLRVLNVGDCACYVVRNDKVVAKSREIVHYFDCPYQLSEDSPDRAQDGTKLNYEVLPGDVIVMGSDGVFDNLDEATICETIADAPPRSLVIAKRIVDKSRKVSLDDKAATPYAKLAKRNGFEDFSTGLGGKLDDVSCIVVRCT